MQKDSHSYSAKSVYILDSHCRKIIGYITCSANRVTQRRHRVSQRYFDIFIHLQFPLFSQTKQPQ